MTISQKDFAFFMTFQKLCSFLQKLYLFLGGFDHPQVFLLNKTNRLTTSVSADLLMEVDSLVKQGANYQNIFPKIRTFERFMLENEVLSRIPDSICNQKKRFDLNEENKREIKTRILKNK